MSNCVPVCLISFALIGYFVGSQIVKLNKDIFVKFKNSLDNYQQSIYSSIISERRNIAVCSITVSLLLSTLVCFHLYYSKDLNTPINNLVCLFITLTLFFTLVGYNIMPKSKYMLSYLTDTEQINNWLEIYKSFKQANFTGLVLGLVVFYIYISFKEKGSAYY